jgi:hypothetical protein
MKGSEFLFSDNESKQHSILVDVVLNEEKSR